MLRKPLFDVLTYGMRGYDEEAQVIEKTLPHLIISTNKQILTDHKRYWALLEINDSTAIMDHIIKDRTCCNPEFISQVLNYVFQKASICNVFIEVENIPSVRFTEGLGFVFTGILRQDPSYLYIYSMTADEYYTSKWAQYL